MKGKIGVKEQELFFIGDPISPNEEVYTYAALEFVFGKEWEGIDKKYAHFIQADEEELIVDIDGNADGKKVTVVAIPADNTITLPEGLIAGAVELAVYGESLNSESEKEYALITNTISFNIVPNSYDLPEPPTSSEA